MIEHLIIIIVVIVLFLFFFRSILPFHLHVWVMKTPSTRKCTKCGKKQNRVCYPWISNNVYWEDEK